MVKYYIDLGDNTTVGLRYDPGKGKLVVGGYTKHETAIIGIMEMVEGYERSRRVQVQKNKVRYELDDVPTRVGFGLISELRKIDSVVLVRTKSFENLMR